MDIAHYADRLIQLAEVRLLLEEFQRALEKTHRLRFRNGALSAKELLEHLPVGFVVLPELTVVKRLVSKSGTLAVLVLSVPKGIGEQRVTNIALRSLGCFYHFIYPN